MEKKLKKYNKSLLITIFFITLSAMGLTGCKPKEINVSSIEDTSEGLSDTTIDTTKEEISTTDLQQETEQDSQPEQDIEQTVQEESQQSVQGESQQEIGQQEEVESGQDADQEDSLTSLISLLGLTKEELSDTIGEDSKSIDEGGLEFTKYGIRVWFDEEALVNQIYIMKNNINLNGVKTGDKISAFKEIFGDPLKDKNGDAHFKYGNIYLSVNYDTDTEETYSIYILKEDF